jgi:formylglycine-generating enzyme required for sulfatase activity
MQKLPAMFSVACGGNNYIIIYKKNFTKMKKLIVLFVAVFCALCTYGQTPPKITIYTTGDSDLSTKKIFGSKLVGAITRAGEFKATDHTADYDAEVKKQKGFSHIVTVEDVFAVENNFGAQFFCLVTMSTSGDFIAVAASLLNPETEDLSTTTVEVMRSLPEMDKTADKLAKQIADIAAGRVKEQPKKRGIFGLFKKNQKENVEKQETVGPIDDSLLFNMIYVQGGTFIMGCPDEPKACEKDEKPTHQVTLSDFYIGATEVTYAQWKAVMGSYPAKKIEGNDQLPVCVSWLEVQDFIGKLNVNNTGRKYRLPTEAEWEYAARGGNTSQSYKYSGSNDVDEVAWYADNSGRKTHIVGGKQTNELGLYDMSGNVWEWCRDRYDKYSDAEQSDPVITESGKNRVIRGGSWDAKREDIRAWRRASENPDKQTQNIGFRLARNTK